ncbi:MAG: hypothetical protein V5A62_11320 [Haloarculaceae archaeon]
MTASTQRSRVPSMAIHNRSTYVRDCVDTGIRPDRVSHWNLPILNIIKAIIIGYYIIIVIFSRSGSVSHVPGHEAVATGHRSVEVSTDEKRRAIDVEWLDEHRETARDRRFETVRTDRRGEGVGIVGERLEDGGEVARVDHRRPP